jgi:hypothetical protein
MVFSRKYSVRKVDKEIIEVFFSIVEIKKKSFISLTKLKNIQPSLKTNLEQLIMKGIIFFP